MLDAARFNRELRELRTPKECGALFARAIEPFGFDTFACGEVDIIHGERSAFHVIGWPDAWKRYYIQSGLIERDPLIDELRRRNQPYTWSDLRADRRLSKPESDVLKSAAEAGWNEGLVVPLPLGGGRVGLVSLAGHRNCTDPAERGHLTLISICLHSYVRTLVCQHGFAVPPAGLTEREIASIRLVALGRADADIAGELGIAVSTAHEFVEKAKHRLHVRSRAELASVATAIGLVHP
jgi:DNA-binding CsgD family transcriptional regulator